MMNAFLLRQAANGRVSPGIATMRPLAVITLMATLLAGHARADLVYVAGSYNDLGKLDLATGAFTRIGTMALPAGDGLYGLAPYNPGTLVGIDAVGEAYFIDIATAKLTDAGNTGIQVPLGLGGGDGTIAVVGLNPGGVYTLNFNGPGVSTTTVAPIDSYFIGTGLTAVGPDGFIYATGFPDGSTFPPPGDPEFLFKIDPKTGAVTEIGQTGLGSLDDPRATTYTGAFIGSTLYGIGLDGGEYTVDTSTGAATFVTTTSLPGGELIYAISAAPVPEPSSLALCGIAGIAGLGLTWRRCWARVTAT